MKHLKLILNALLAFALVITYTHSPALPNNFKNNILTTTEQQQSFKILGSCQHQNYDQCIKCCKTYHRFDPYCPIHCDPN